MGLSCTVSELEGDFHWKSQNFPTSCILRPHCRTSHWNWIFAHAHGVNTGRQQRPRLRIASCGRNSNITVIKTMKYFAIQASLPNLTMNTVISVLLVTEIHALMYLEWMNEFSSWRQKEHKHTQNQIVSPWWNYIRNGVKLSSLSYQSCHSIQNTFKLLSQVYIY